MMMGSNSSGYSAPKLDLDLQNWHNLLVDKHNHCDAEVNNGGGWELITD